MTVIDLYPDWGMPSEECPKCAKELSTRRGMETHATKQHAISLAFAVVQCDECNHVYRKKRTIAEKSEYDYCSKKCESEWKAGREAPPDHNFRKQGKVEYECERCGEMNKTYPSLLEQGEKNFCDRECAAAYKRGREVDESHNFYKGGPAIVECAWCNEELERRPCKLDRSEKFFCGDKNCEGKWKSENMVRGNHPNWKGGHDHDYGPNWREQRDKRLEKDGYECVVCGMSNGEHREQHGTALHVHHIQRKDSFKDENGVLDYERANRLENLVTLCYKCHGRWEGIPLRPGGINE